MSVLSNLGGGQNGYLPLTITIEDYAAQAGFAFMPPHNLGDCPSTMGNAQDQALRTEKFRQNHALFRKYTSVDGTLKNSNHPGGGTSFPVPTGGPANRIHTSILPYNVNACILELRDDRNIDLEENDVKMIGP